MQYLIQEPQVKSREKSIWSAHCRYKGMWYVPAISTWMKWKEANETIYILMGLYLAELNNSAYWCQTREISQVVPLKRSLSLALFLYYNVISDWDENISGRHIRFMEDERLGETANIWRKDIALRNRCPEIIKVKWKS